MGQQLVSEFLTFEVSARRIDAHGSLAIAENAEINMDTAMQKSGEAFNPVELLLAALSACMIKGIDRVVPTLNFQLSGVSVNLKATRPVDEPRISEIEYVITVDSSEELRRIELLHENVMKFGTIFNTVSAGTNLHGVMVARTADA